MSTRKIKAEKIKSTVKSLCIKANNELREDVLSRMKEFSKKESSLSKKMLEVLLENAALAKKKALPICQDTGLLVAFIEIGKDAVINGMSLTEAVNEGVEEAYKEGFFRKSIVKDPLIRKNTGTNTPASIHVDITSGNKLSISVMPKGFGSENKGRAAMLNPTCKSRDIVNFCVETVKAAGPDACPPYIIGVGIGGTMDSCALLAKKALLRDIRKANPKKHLAEIEKKVMKEANSLKIGVMGLGGASTVIGVNVEAEPTHIAGCPIAVNLSCHALRSASATI